MERPTKNYFLFPKFVSTAPDIKTLLVKGEKMAKDFGIIDKEDSFDLKTSESAKLAMKVMGHHVYRNTDCNTPFYIRCAVLGSKEAFERCLALTYTIPDIKTMGNAFLRILYQTEGETDLSLEKSRWIMRLLTWCDNIPRDFGDFTAWILSGGDSVCKHAENWVLKLGMGKDLFQKILQEKKIARFTEKEPKKTKMVGCVCVFSLDDKTKEELKKIDEYLRC